MAVMSSASSSSGRRHNQWAIDFPRPLAPAHEPSALQGNAEAKQVLFSLCAEGRREAEACRLRSEIAGVRLQCLQLALRVARSVKMPPHSAFSSE